MKFLALSLCLALACQLVGFIVMSPVTFDSHEYLALSRSLIDGHVYSAPAGLNGFQQFRGENPTRMRNPGYPLFLCVTYWRAGCHVLLVRLIQSLLNLASFVLVYFVARRLLGSRFSRGGMILCATYFPWLWTSALLLTESLFIFLLTLAVFLIAETARGDDPQRDRQHQIPPQRGPWPVIISGAFLGSATLVRPIAGILAVWTVPLFVSRFGLTGGLRKLTLFAAGAAIVLAPWAIRNTAVLRTFTPFSSEAGYNLWASTVPEGAIWKGEAQFREATGEGYYLDQSADTGFRRLALRNVLSDVPRYIRRCLARTVRTWVRFPGSGTLEASAVRNLLGALQVTILALAIVGSSCLRSYERWILGFPAIGLLSVTPFSSAGTRLLLPAMPYLLILCGQGIQKIRKNLRARQVYDSV